MNPTSQAIPSPKEVVRILITYRKRWLVPTALFAVLAMGYVLVRSDTWEASQALIVRNEAANNTGGPGEFGHADEMKTLQETILELVKSRGVLSAALKAIGPPAGYRGDQAAWPTARNVADLRDTVKLAPPKGAEFGMTEVFYLQVRDHDSDRVIALNGAICDQLETRFQQLRDAKAQSMIDELVKTVHLAKADLDESTVRLTAIETQVGSDLAELRALNQAGSGSDSVIRTTITEIRNELRQINAAEKADRQLFALLREAQDDPGRLVATPNQLLDSQPALRQLKEGLIDAQINTAQLKGNMSDVHPLVQSARQSEVEIGRHLHNELAIAIRGLEVEIRSNVDRQAMLQEQLTQNTDRLSSLAELRATYSNQLAETGNRTQLVKRAEQTLAEARATHASAKASSLISRIDTPETGINPVGPSRSMTVLFGLAGGLLTGLGVVFLTVQPLSPDTAAPGAESRSLPPTPAARPAFTPAIPMLQPNGALSFKQALRKINYASLL